MTLRHALRDRLQPGEGVIGWSVATIGPGWWWRGLDVGAAVLPPLFLARALTSIDATRLLVLTDRRLLSLYAAADADSISLAPLAEAPRAGRSATGDRRRQPGPSVRLDVPVHSVVIERRAPRRFVVADERGRWKQTVSLWPPDTPPARAFTAGFSVLSDENLA